MPEQIYGSIITDKGLQAITAAIQHGVEVKITACAVGDGAGAYYLPTPSATALKNEVWRGQATGSISTQSPNIISVQATIPADVGGFTVREMAIFSDNGIMIAIANCPDTLKTIVEDGVSSELQLEMQIAASNAEAITFVIDPTVVTATLADLTAHNMDEDAHSDLMDTKSGIVVVPSDTTIPVSARKKNTFYLVETNTLSNPLPETITINNMAVKVVD